MLMKGEPDCAKEADALGDAPPNGVRTFLALLMSLLGHFHPSRCIGIDGSLSHDSFRARRVAVTAALGQQRSWAGFISASPAAWRLRGTAKSTGGNRSFPTWRRCCGRTAT